MANNQVTDQLGLVRENEHLTVYFPQANKAMVFRVVSRYNTGFSRFDYGKIPLTTGTVLRTYNQGSGNATVQNFGIIPAEAIVTNLRFPLQQAWDQTDMWYVPYTWTNRIFHSKLTTRPAFLKVGVQIPTNVNQQRFQREQVVGGVDQLPITYQPTGGVGNALGGFGYQRGGIELVHFPEIHYGYTFGNDTNLPLKTRATFTYGEYIVEIPPSADFIYAVLSRQIPSHWVSLPMTTTDAQVTQGLRKTWGFDGFTLYPSLKKNAAIAEYTQIITSKDVVGRGVVG